MSRSSVGWSKCDVCGHECQLMALHMRGAKCVRVRLAKLGHRVKTKVDGDHLRISCACGATGSLFRRNGETSGGVFVTRCGVT
jgi:hypothetical protein